MDGFALLQIEGDAVLADTLVADDDGSDGGLFDRLAKGESIVQLFLLSLTQRI